MVGTSSPTLLLDEQKVRANIERMIEKAKVNNLTLKPHFKTHQSKQIGGWFKEYEITKITVSSVKMAEYFAEDGWADITIAFPCNVLQIDRINKLAEDINLSILISDPEIVTKIDAAIDNKVQAYIEIDTGSGRTGLKPDQPDKIKRVINQLVDSQLLRFRGFYSHPGHSYSAQSKQEVKAIHRDAVHKMQQLKSTFKGECPNLLCCVGDTPCCSVGENWDGIDEISAGNFVFYDLMQENIGSCKASDIAVALACPVVATYPERNEIAIHGGAVHLSKDSMIINGETAFGKIVHLNEDLTWSDTLDGTYVKSISQEHGIVKCSEPAFQSINIGDVIGILPIHSCLTADTMKSYLTCRTFQKIDHLQAFQ